ncbi:hypothetical protein JMF97_30760, partial [Micromonospora fiedleri]
AGRRWQLADPGWQRCANDRPVPRPTSPPCPLLLAFGEFVVRDVEGRWREVGVDGSEVDGPLEHLDTTPAAIAAAAGVLPTVLPDLEA